MAEINEFDDQLKDALSNLGNDLSPRDWDSFAEKLSAANGPSPLEATSNFDDLIRSRMESLEVAANANHWDVLESKIDQELNVPEISDEALDNLATDNLSNLYIPYNPTHWTLMSHRLEEEFNVRRKIVNYKVAEFSLMVLLLLTIVQFMPSYPITNNTDVVIHEEGERQGIVASSTDQLVAAVTLPEATAPIAASSEKINHSKSIPAVSTEKKIATDANNSTTIILVTEQNNPPIELSAPSENISIIVNKEIVPEEENALMVLEDPAPLANQPTLLHLTELPVNISALDYTTTDWSGIGVLKKFPKKVMVRLGAMTSADLNYIKTPPNTSQYKDKGYQQYQLGYGGGITLDLNYEQLTLSTGLIYRRINYYPQEEINIGGSFVSYYQSHVFDAVNLNLLTIPMNLQFQMNNPDKKWKLHAVTGASLNVLALNHYNITVNNLGRNNPTNVPAPSAPGSESNTLTELAREADIAGEGLFEGGSFERNHYFTANVGIGVERFISPRWSLFIQPIYQHEIFGKNLGLNRDRIHTFSVQVGAKSTFK